MYVNPPACEDLSCIASSYLLTLHSKLIVGKAVQVGCGLGLPLATRRVEGAGHETRRSHALNVVIVLSLSPCLAEPLFLPVRAQPTRAAYH